MGLLSKVELEHFDREGFVVVRDVVPGSYIQRLADEISAAIDQQARMLHEEGEITSLHEDLGFLDRATEIYKESTKIFETVYSGSHSGKAMFELLTCPEILDIMEQLIGPEVIASSIYRLRPKLPFEKNGEVPWHQDSGYFDTCADEHLVPTCWVPLMDATIEAGCMEVLPRSHKQGVLRHYWANLTAPSLTVHPDHLPDQDPVPVPADIGDAVLMTNLTPHSSIPNNSGLIRWAADLRYNTPEAGDYGPFEAEFLARSTATPGAVMTDWREFDHLRKNHVSTGKIDRTWLRHDEETFLHPEKRWDRDEEKV